MMKVAYGIFMSLTMVASLAFAKKVPREPSTSLPSAVEIKEDLDLICKSSRLSLGFTTDPKKENVAYILDPAVEGNGYKLDHVKIDRLRCPYCYDIEGDFVGTHYEFTIRAAGFSSSIDVDVEVQPPPFTAGGKKPRVKKYNDIPCTPVK